MTAEDYVLVLDTNVLFMNHDTKADFTTFSFNSALNTIKNRIESVELYENVKIAIPTVVWAEMKKQNIEKYLIKKRELEDKIKSTKFPNFDFNFDEMNYEKFLDIKIEEYREKLFSIDNSVKTFELSLPTKNCFNNLVERAFDKRPPFEGKETKSDKGFKDAILWESILEFKKNNKSKNIILYAKDTRFCDELKKEYYEKYKDRIEIFNKEDDLKEFLGELAKKVNYDVVVPNIETFENNLKEKINYWLFDEQFKYDFESNLLHKGIIDIGDYVNSLEILDYNFLDIIEVDNKDYYLYEVLLHFTIKKNGLNFVIPYTKKWNFHISINVENNLSIDIAHSELCDEYEAEKWLDIIKYLGSTNE